MAPEFVPCNMQNEANQYNPYSAAQSQYSPYCGAQSLTKAPQPNCLLLSLDGYSDDSSSEDETDSNVEKPMTKAAVKDEWGCMTKPSVGTTMVDPSTEDSDSSSVVDSDTSDEEQKSSQQGAQQMFNRNEANSEVLTIPTLLKERHAVEWLDGYDDRLSAERVTPRTEEQQTSDGPKMARNTPQTKAGQRRDRPGQKRGRAEKPGSGGKKLANTEQQQDLELHVSNDSWLSQQVQRRRGKVDSSLSDADVLRAMKSNLNKLTIEKFEPIYQKLVTCGITTSHHLEALINEVFEKATTQHHYINMYADLCERLHAHFIEHPITDNPKSSFKKILLNGCQAFFEGNLKPPEDLDKLEEEERVAVERKYKTNMLGNIKFVGALLVRQMLASKVFFAICEELLTNPTSESLEALAALLTVVGPVFDTPEWPSRGTLLGIFDQVQASVKDPQISLRVRFLLRDVLELRAARWRDHKPKKAEGPSTLQEVADTQAKDEAASGTSAKSALSSRRGGDRGRGKAPQWTPQTSPSSSYPGQRVTSLAGLFNSGTASPKSAPSKEGYQRINSLAALKGGDRVTQTAAQPSNTPDNAQFDKDGCRKEVSGVLAELRLSYDVKEAIARMSALSVPTEQQADELCNMLGCMVEEGSAEVRKMCFELVPGLFTDGSWNSDALRKGLQEFMDEVCPDLRCDVPALPNILREELLPVLVPLGSRGILQQSQLDALASPP